LNLEKDFEREFYSINGPEPQIAPFRFTKKIKSKVTEYRRNGTLE
jgi:hypothetical protein